MADLGVGGRPLSLDSPLGPLSCLPLGSSSVAGIEMHDKFLTSLLMFPWLNLHMQGTLVRGLPN